MLFSKKIREQIYLKNPCETIAVFVICLFAENTVVYVFRGIRATLDPQYLGKTKNKKNVDHTMDSANKRRAGKKESLAGKRAWAFRLVYVKVSHNTRHYLLLVAQFEIEFRRWVDKRISDGV